MLMASITNLLPLIITHLKTLPPSYLTHKSLQNNSLLTLLICCSLTTASKKSVSMPYMALRSTFTACFFLFLVLSHPYFSTGASQSLESAIYEIDYRGPETHSSSPPPDHHQSHASPLSNHRKASLGSGRVNKGLTSSNNHPKQEKVKGIHG